jgi:hypothetical protein
LRIFLVLPFPNIFNELSCPKAIVSPLLLLPLAKRLPIG